MKIQATVILKRQIEVECSDHNITVAAARQNITTASREYLRGVNECLKDDKRLTHVDVENVQIVGL